MNLKKILFIIFLINIGMKNNNYSQEAHIAGGGDLKRLGTLKKSTKKNNEELIKINDANRVVFMGNSITEGWSFF